MRTAGLQLCDNNASSSYGAARCDYLNGGCQGSNNGSCWPNHIWSGLFLATGYYQGFALNSGGLKSTGICDGTGRCETANAFAVRCVLDLNCTCAYIILQLCDGYESFKYGAARCAGLGGGCQGATGDPGNPNSCYPHDVWAFTEGSGSCRYWRILINGAFNENCNPVTYAFSVRCVLDLKKPRL